MTKKEKAKELIDNFNNNVVTHHTNMSKLSAKQCALICVEEIIKIVPSVYATKDEKIHNGHRQYWEGVKQEINKL